MVTHAEIHYRSPARYGNTLAIETQITNRSKATLTFAHVIPRNERVSVRSWEAPATLATVNLEGKLKRLPQALLKRYA